jgi:hypothetical protein
MPDLVRYQLRDGPRAGEPITERGEIERLARVSGGRVPRRPGFNRDRVERAGRGRDSPQASRLPAPRGGRGPATQAEGSLGRAGCVGDGPAPWWTVARASLFPSMRRRPGLAVSASEIGVAHPDARTT